MTQDMLSETLRTFGRAYKTGGNKPLFLTSSGSVWYIAHGHVDVFTSRLEDNQPLGTRNYFFTAGKGELLFGISHGRQSNDRGLIALPSPNAEIISLGIEQLKEMMMRPALTDILATLLDTWIGHLSQSISRDINPPTNQLIDISDETKVEANLKIRSKKGIVWVEFITGNALFLGMKEIMESEIIQKFPVSQDSWLYSLEVSTIRTFKTSDICLEKDFFENLENFYEVIFYCDFFNSRLYAVDEFNRLKEKTVHDSRIYSSALIKIASVINENLRKSYIDTVQDSLLTACRLVAGSSKISITAPKRPKSEDAPPLTLNDILRSSRFRDRKVKLEGKWWEKDNGPLLAFKKEGDFPVALIPKSPSRYEYISPGENIRQVLTAKEAFGLATEAHQFYRPFPDIPLNGFNLMRFSLKGSMRDILIIFLAGLIGGALTILVPLITGNIFDVVIPQSDYRQLYVYSLVIFFSIIAIAFFQLIRSFSMIRIETKIDFALQSAIWDRLLNLPVPFFRKYQAGELAAKANSIMLLRKILSETVVYSLLGAVFMLFNFFVMFYYDLSLSLYISVFLLIFLLSVFFIGKKIQSRQKSIIELQNNIFGMLIQFLSSISKIRIAGAEAHAFLQWAGKFSKNKRETYEVRKLFMIITLMSTVLPLIIILFVFGMISWQIPNTLSTGQFMAFFAALTLTVVAVLQLGMAMVSFLMVIPLFDSVRPILEAARENNAIKPEAHNLSGEIEVSNVSFRYQPDGPLVLKNVSLQISPGEFIAVVGASGSGKSTLLRLLLGFEVPESGSVYYDRQNLSSFDPTSLRRQAGTVLQQSQLIPGNIASNIIGMTNATYEDAWEAARNVGLEEDINQMPMGMLTVVTGGLSTISGGQRERIMIARAIVNKPRILFFDEATSALDNKTQQKVSKSLEKLQATRVVIAHRLTTIMNADRIYLMENGKIEETGTYQELINKAGKFADLVKRQMIE
jgi:NHLM bacteriocin system ABC transporter ATP-binding protein